MSLTCPSLSSPHCTPECGLDSNYSTPDSISRALISSSASAITRVGLVGLSLGRLFYEMLRSDCSSWNPRNRGGMGRSQG